MNPAVARIAVEQLLNWGVRDFCICAGARNAPLVSQLANTQGIRIYSFFEERSAAFFALGLIRETNRAAAVVVTSGTAVAECLPAVIEAYYQGLPLAILSADRPRRYRNSGAPQAIEQVGIFSGYVEKCLDIEAGDALTRSEWGMRRPLHLNVCLEEPIATEIYPALGAIASVNLSARAFTSTTVSQPALQEPVAIIGPLTEEEKSFVSEFLQKNPIPFVAEGPSGLSLDEATWQRRIRAPEKTLPLLLQENRVRSVLRLGGVPTLRFWRDLEEKYAGLPVTSYSSLRFTGLSRSVNHVQGFQNLSSLPVESSFQIAWLERDRESFERLLVLFEKYPRAEMSMVRRFALRAHREPVYLGNSLPIREWDQAAADLQAPWVWANRGANGIDGQFSSFLGWTAAKGAPAWALVGDLTALYDLAAPWIGSQIEERSRRLVIVNNFGGQIFKPMFRRDSFLNRHEIRFQAWAQMWGWDYLASEDGEVFHRDLTGNQVIELLPDEVATDLFSREWKAL